MPKILEQGKLKRIINHMFKNGLVKDLFFLLSWMIFLAFIFRSFILDRTVLINIFFLSSTITILINFIESRNIVLNSLEENNKF